MFIIRYYTEDTTFLECLFRAASFCNTSFSNISQNLSFNTIEDANKMQCFFPFGKYNIILLL